MDLTDSIRKAAQQQPSVRREQNTDKEQNINTSVNLGMGRPTLENYDVMESDGQIFEE